MHNIHDLLDALARAYEPRRHRRLLEALWREERWFDASHQRAAAELAAEALARAGLSEVELVPYAADGRTRYQDWTTRMSWECPEAWLRPADAPGELLANRAVCPAAAVMGSGPLGSRGSPVRGRVVDGDAAPLRPEAARGAFVLTRRNPGELKPGLAGSAPAAIVSDFIPTGPGYGDEATAWINAWSDDPDGWYVHAPDAPLAGLMLSPRAGQGLRERLERRPGLVLEGCCESRLEAGEGQCVTAVLGGRRRDREVWIFGHGCEQGAGDNASGVSSLIQALALLAELVRRGDLPRPRLSLRAIVTEECLGMAAFATIRHDLRRRALCGLNLDAVGDASDHERPFNLAFGPLSSPGFGWAVAGLLAESLMRRLKGRWFARPTRFVPTADDMIADPACGIPALWLGHGKEAVGYHSSADVPAICVPESLEAAALLAAAWGDLMASLDDELAAELLDPAAGWLGREIAGQDELGRWAAGGAIRDLGRFGVAASVYGETAARFAPVGAPPLPDLPASGARYRRLTWGTCTLETIEPTRRPILSRWNEAQQAFLYWLALGYPVEAARRLARAEAGELSVLSDEEVSLTLSLGREAGCLLPTPTGTASGDGRTWRRRTRR